MKTINSMKHLPLFITLTAALILSGCQKTEAVEKKPIRPAQIWQVTEQIFETTDTYAGKIEPQRTTDLSFRVAGKLIGRHVNVGDRVEKGQEIARLDTEDSDLRVRSANANLQAAQGDVDSARANLSAARNNYTASQGALASTQSNLGAAQGTISSARGNVAAIRASLTSTQAAADSARATHRSAQANYAAAKAAIGVVQAELESAQGQYNRTNTLFQRKFISKMVLDRDQQRLRTAQANLKSATAQATSLLEQVKSAQAQISSAQAQIKTVQAQIYAAEGEQASAGANAESLQGQIQSAKAQAESAKAQIKIAEARLQSAEANVKALKTQTGLAQNQSNYTVLHSESAGVVTSTLVEPGQVIAAGQPVLQLAMTEQIEAHIRVGESAIKTIKPGMKADVSLWADSPDIGREPLAATVHEISPVAGNSRTWLVKLTLDKPPEAIRFGMTARVVFRAALAANVVWLPSTALFQQNEAAAVWVLDDTNQVQLQTISVEEYLTDGMLVSGLSVGDKIITAGVNRLYPGQEIKPIAYNGQAQAVVTK